MCLALDGRRYRGPDAHACQRAYRSVRGPRTQWRAMGVAGAHRGRNVLRPTATKLGAKIRGRVAAASERANAAFQRSKSSIVAAPSASIASRAAQAGGRIPGGASMML